MKYLPLYAIGSIILATPIASLTFYGYLITYGEISFTFLGPLTTLTCWWLYAWYYGHSFPLPLALTMLIPAAFILAAFILANSRRRVIKPARKNTREFREPERAASRTHGDADWMPMDEAQKLFPGSNKHWGGIPVGEAYQPLFVGQGPKFMEDDPQTWAEGGKHPLLLTPLTRGAISGLIFAGSGGYKTTSFTIPACHTWLGSMVIMDPSLQVGRMVADKRSRMGQVVALLDPSADRTSRFPHSMNILKLIDIHDPLAIIQMEELADWCGGQKSEQKENDGDNAEFFAQSAREVELCLLADMLWDETLPWERKTVREWRARMTIPDDVLPKELARINRHSQSPYARQLAGSIMHMRKTADRTWGGIYKHMTTEMRWLSIPAFADMLSDDGFDPRLITAGRMTAILQIGDDTLTEVPQIARVIIGTFGRIILRARGKVATPIPFILDEMVLLGRMKIIEILRDQGRKSGAALFPMWQSIGQAKQTWGENGLRSWYASAAWRMYSNINDDDTAKEVQERCGKYTVINRSEGWNQSSQRGGQSRGINDSLTEGERYLLSAYDAQTRLRPDTAVLIPRGERALLVSRPLWWRREEMKDAFAVDQYRRAA